MKVYKSITDLVGNTPIIQHKDYNNVFMKMECFNPLGSVKDRVALAIVEDLEKKGEIKQGGVIVEATSGNTGIGLAYVCAAKGYQLILTMPETMSDERKNLLRALGAKLVLTPGSLGMRGAVEKAEEIKRNTANSFLALQFENSANPTCHYKTTAQEIYSAMDKNIDVFVSGIGTGGTFSGCVKYLKEKNPNLYAVAVEPADSPLLTKGEAGSHKIQGIGANFIPANFDKSLCDEVMDISFESAKATICDLVKGQGIFVGISSGASVYAAISLCKREKFQGKKIVAILPDTGERYMSTGVFLNERI